MRDALDGAITAIGASGCETPRLDAELLLADVLCVSRERLIVDRDLTVEGPAVRAFQNAVRRRAVEREPVAYILGHRGFRRIDLAVDRRALIPRPETELLVEVALSLPRGTRVLDVGTGSGAVALALKDERSDLHVSGSDLSEDALALARFNGEGLGLEVSWLHADLLWACLTSSTRSSPTRRTFPSQTARRWLLILRHEPSGALSGVGRADGDPYAARPGRGSWSVQMVALEVGAGQASTVMEIARAAGFPRARAEQDLVGVERVVVGER